MTESRGKEHSTRDKILTAAATLLGEGPTARLSVRAVAARAGVSTGSLRHFFPTQRALIDEVVAGIYGLEMFNDPIDDPSRPASDRLVACLQQILVHVGTGQQAREMWRAIHRAYLVSEPSEGATETYLALERGGQDRIKRWLDILVEEGSIPAGDNDRRARYLSTVLNGLSVERALPADAARLAAETETLHLAVRGILNDHDPPHNQRGS